MKKEKVRCPRDPEIHYYKEACVTIFRKNNIRVWCKDCKVFQHKENSIRS